MAAAAKNFELNEQRFEKLLETLINETEFLQNSPPKFIPEESRVARHVMQLLEPYRIENGGVLKVELVEYVANRGNLIIQYSPASATGGTVSFVGSHMDVVPANAADWKFPPFKYSRDGDRLQGRGTTDCLGHVALITDLFLQLAETKPALTRSVVAVFIASEESTVIPGVGVEKLLEEGKLDNLKNGPLYWIDSADSQPCIGTAGVVTWNLRAEGKLFHSGLPHKGINALELGMEAVSIVQKRFYEDYPPHPKEQAYSFVTPSTLKPTQVKCSSNSLNQIPYWAEIEGDIRLTPFYQIGDAVKSVTQYVADMAADVTAVPTRGPVSKYRLTEEDGSVKEGKLSVTFSAEPIKGIACSIESAGYRALCDATVRYKGEVKPYSICGSLPLVGDLQTAGFDIQVAGYGLSSVYHGDNEYCLMSEMKVAMRILSDIVFTLGTSA